MTPDQRRAAGLIAQGHTQKQAAEEVGVSAKTLGRWAKSEEFRAVVRKQRGSLIGDVDTPEAVLAAALTATKPSGEPDWSARIMAARALLSTPVASPDAEQAAQQVVRETRIYIPPEDASVNGYGEEEDVAADPE